MFFKKFYPLVCDASPADSATAGVAGTLNLSVTAQRAPIFGVPHLCRHPLTQNNQIRSGNNMAEGHVFTGSAMPYPKGVEPSASGFLVPPSNQ